MTHSSLETLAHRYGITTSYPDIDGHWHHAEPEPLLAVLQSLGAPMSSVEEAASALRQRELETWRTVVDPVCVAWDDAPVRLKLRLENPNLPIAVRIEIALENGQTQPHILKIEHDNVSASAEIEGARFVEVPLELPALPFGRHRVTVELFEHRFSGWIFQAPYRAWPAAANAWGVFAPTYALKSKATLGVGDFGDLKRLVEWTERQGGSFVATLPLLPSFLSEPFDPSPYAPVSRLFWNEFYLDLGAILRTQPCLRAAALLAENEYFLASQRETQLIDYRVIGRIKRSVLDELSRAFMATSSFERERFEKFLAEKPEVVSYATFRAAQESLHGNWRNWPVTSTAPSGLNGQYRREAFEAHLYAQWRAHEQVHAAASQPSAGLYLDLPVGAHPDGYDAWAYRSSFLADVCAGAPPDSFFSKGQNWGFSPLHPDRIREQGYGYVQACLDHHLVASKLLRIDHVMGLHRIFCVPAGMPASSGIYVRYRYDELYALLTLASVRHRSTVVGEDLGTVPNEVREQMEHHGLLKMYVGQFSMSEHGLAIQAPGTDVLASLNTHDTPPFAAFVAGLDIRDREKLGLLSPEQTEVELQARERLVGAVRRELGADGESNEVLLEKLVAFLTASPARYRLLALEDAWLAPDPQNVPGTQFERPNWQRRLAHALEDLDDFPALQRLLSILRERHD